MPYFIRNHLGSVRTIVDGSTGDVLETSDYLPFGKRWELTGGQSSQTVTDPTNRWRFSGKETQSFYNPTIPYNDFGARLHDPRTGRWLGVDPLAEKYYSLSPFSYCANNVARSIDYLGKAWFYNNDTGAFVAKTDDKDDAIYMLSATQISSVGSNAKKFRKFKSMDNKFGQLAIREELSENIATAVLTDLFNRAKFQNRGRRREYY